MYCVKNIRFIRSFMMRYVRKFMVPKFLWRKFCKGSPFFRGSFFCFCNLLLFWKCFACIDCELDLCILSLNSIWYYLKKNVCFSFKLSTSRRMFLSILVFPCPMLPIEMGVLFVWNNTVELCSVRLLASEFFCATYVVCVSCVPVTPLLLRRLFPMLRLFLNNMCILVDI